MNEFARRRQSLERDRALQFFCRCHGMTWIRENLRYFASGFMCGVQSSHRSALLLPCLPSPVSASLTLPARFSSSHGPLRVASMRCLQIACLYEGFCSGPTIRLKDVEWFIFSRCHDMPPFCFLMFLSLQSVLLFSWFPDADFDTCEWFLHGSAKFDYCAGCGLEYIALLNDAFQFCFPFMALAAWLPLAW